MFFCETNTRQAHKSVDLNTKHNPVADIDPIDLILAGKKIHALANAFPIGKVAALRSVLSGKAANKPTEINNKLSKKDDHIMTDSVRFRPTVKNTIDK